MLHIQTQPATDLLVRPTAGCMVTLATIDPALGSMRETGMPAPCVPAMGSCVCAVLKHGYQQQRLCGNGIGSSNVCAVMNWGRTLRCDIFVTSNTVGGGRGRAPFVAGTGCNISVSQRRKASAAINQTLPVPRSVCDIQSVWTASSHRENSPGRVGT